MTVKIFVFNPFMVNTFLIYDDTGDCVIIDAACNEKDEILTLQEFIGSNKLNPKALINTHGHVDHICGNADLIIHYNLPLLMHKEDLFLVNSAVQHGLFFGFTIKQPPGPTRFINEGMRIEVGNSFLEIIHAPGHSPGSVMFYSSEDNFLIAGDVLFSGSIGRSDLAGGDYKVLINSIRTKILTLPPETLVYPGHGPSTTVGKESLANPYLQ